MILLRHIAPHLFVYILWALLQKFTLILYGNLTQLAIRACRVAVSLQRISNLGRAVGRAKALGVRLA